MDYCDNGTIAFDGGQVVLAWSDNSNATGDNPDGTDGMFDIVTGVLNA